MSSVDELPAERAAKKQNSDVGWPGPSRQHKETSAELHSIETSPVSSNTPVNIALQALPGQGIQLQITCLKKHCLYRDKFSVIFLTRILHFLYMELSQVLQYKMQ